MGIVHTTCVPNSAHYTGKWRELAWSTPVVALFPGHRPLLFVRVWESLGTRVLLYVVQVLFRLHRVKLITDHS